MVWVLGAVLTCRFSGFKSAKNDCSHAREGALTACNRLVRTGCCAVPLLLSVPLLGLAPASCSQAANSCSSCRLCATQRLHQSMQSHGVGALAGELALRYSSFTA